MTTISTEKTKFDKNTNVFHISGKEVIFSSEYKLINPATKGSMVFNLSHSTGSEWDSNTVWVYKSECKKYELHVGNDDVTPAHAENYLRAKLKN